MISERGKAYREYLKTEHWGCLRGEALARDGGRCVRCGRGSWLNVHHLVYRTPWERCTVDDLVTLCEGCHAKEHGKSVRTRMSLCHRLVNEMFDRFSYMMCEADLYREGDFLRVAKLAKTRSEKHRVKCLIRFNGLRKYSFRRREGQDINDRGLERMFYYAERIMKRLRKKRV